MEEKGDREDLAAFHAANKLVLMACHQQLMHEMGRLVAYRAKMEPAELFFHYRHLLCAALIQVPRYTNNINVLQHALGYFSNRVSGEEKAYCLRLIGSYKEGHATLAEPRDLLRSWVIRLGEPARLNQTFFAPYPVEPADLPEKITDRGRDVWGWKRSAVQHVREPGT